MSRVSVQEVGSPLAKSPTDHDSAIIGVYRVISMVKRREGWHPRLAADICEIAPKFIVWLGVAL